MIDVIKTTNPFSKTDECLKITNNQSNELAYNFGDILEESKSYTFSCWFKADTNLNINIYISDKQSQEYAISTKWNKIVFTATADISKSKKVLFSIPANKTLYAYEGMLELGNLPSDFKPNDKDVDNKVVTLQTNFEIQQGQINSLIKETTIVDDYGNSTSLKDKYFETVATVDGMKINIGDIQTSQGSMSSKMAALELTAKGLTSSVEKAQNTGDSAQTLAQQIADKFEWIVKSGNSSTDFTLTDRTAQLVANNINLNGLVTFKGLSSDVQNKIINPNLFLHSQDLVASNSKKGNKVKGFQTVWISSFESHADIYPYQSEDLIPKVGQIYTIQMMARARIYSDYAYDKSKYDLSTINLFDVETVKCDATDGIYNIAYNPKMLVNSYSATKLDVFNNLMDGTVHKVGSIERVVIRYNEELYDAYMYVASADGEKCQCYYPFVGKQNSGTIQQFWYPNVYGNGIPDSRFVLSISDTWKKYSHTWTVLNGLDSETQHDMILARLDQNQGVGTIEIYAPKFEIGDIATEWANNPLDKANQSTIDNWAKDATVAGETTINGGYIKTNTIKTDQLAVEEIFATGSAVMNIVNAQEINANRITSGLLSAERIDAYGLSIVNKNTNQQTFNISNTGEVTIRGSVSSSNYRNKKSGWAINNDGTAEFNNITARGSVITTDGGIASSGGTGRNLARDTSDKYSAWFKPRNGAYGETMKFGRIVPVFQDADNKFVVSFDLEHTQFTKANDKFVLQLFMLDKNDSSNQVINLKGSVTDKVLTLDSTTNTIYEKTVFVQHDTNKVKILDLTSDSQARSKEKHYSVLVQLSRDVIEYELVACCNYSNGSGQIRIKQLKVEAGDFETDWSLAPEDKTKQVRFWAGATYEDRESAPFIVYNDGSIRATQGEYSGLWTGDIKIGNISIVDSSSQAGNDAILTIQNGDNGVRKVQLTDGGSSMFAQDIVVANNTYSSMITLKQDGSAYFSKGLNIADKTTLNSNGLILDNKTLTTTSDGNGFLFDNDLHIGSAKLSAHLTVHGNTSTDNITIDNTLYFGNILKFTKNENGINIDFI